MVRNKGIYSIVNTVDGSMYIGSASFLSERKSRHITDLQKGTHKNPHLQSAYNKHGKKSFQFRLLELVDENEGLIPQEQIWIDRAIGLDINLYNIALKAGSNLGRKFGKREDGVGKKISMALKGNKNKLGFRKDKCNRGHIRTSKTIYPSNHGCIVCITARNHGKL